MRKKQKDEELCFSIKIKKVKAFENFVPFATEQKKNQPKKILYSNLIFEHMNNLSDFRWERKIRS